MPTDDARRAEACPTCGGLPYVGTASDGVGVECRNPECQHPSPCVEASTLAEAVRLWMALPREVKP